MNVRLAPPYSRPTTPSPVPSTVRERGNRRGAICRSRGRIGRIRACVAPSFSASPTAGDRRRGNRDPQVGNPAQIGRQAVHNRGGERFPELGRGRFGDETGGAPTPSSATPAPASATGAPASGTPSAETLSLSQPGPRHASRSSTAPTTRVSILKSKAPSLRAISGSTSSMKPGRPFAASTEMMLNRECRSTSTGTG